MTVTSPCSAPWAEPAWFSASVGPDGRVVLTGELDVASIDALRASLEVALIEPGEVILINCARLSFIDSAAIAVLLRYQLRAAVRQRRVLLEETSPHVTEVLDLLDLRHLLMDPGG